MTDKNETHYCKMRVNDRSTDGEYLRTPLDFFVIWPMRTCTATCCPSADDFLVNSDEASLSMNTVLLIGTRMRDHTNKVATLAAPHWPPVQFSLFTCNILNDQTHLYLKEKTSRASCVSRSRMACWPFRFKVSLMCNRLPAWVWTTDYLNLFFWIA